MEELKAMFRVCVANKKDGNRCNSPALKGGNFCFQHIGGSLREHTRARSVYNGPKLDFLYPGTRQAIQHNLFVVAQAMNDGHLELATANSYNRIFSACERNLRRFESLCQKSSEEPELLEVPEESPAETTVEAPNSCITDEPATKNDVILTEVSEANEAEEPALSLPKGPALLSPSHNAPPHNDFSSAASARDTPCPESAHPNLSPEPCALSPDDEPLVLTPEEQEIFKVLERRYIDDPSLADRINQTYDQIFERRRAAKECGINQTAPPPTKCTISNLSPD